MHTDENNEEVNLVAIRVGYMLGLRVAADILQIDWESRSEELFDRVERIASGDLTPVPSGAEIRLLYPNTPNIEEARQGDQRAMRAAAKVILDWYVNMVGE